MANMNDTERKLESLGYSQKTLPIFLFQVAIDKAREWLRDAEDAEDAESLEHYWELLDTLKAARDVYKEEMKL